MRIRPPASPAPIDGARRRALLALGLGALAVPAASVLAAAPAARPLVEIWKSPTCGCCKDWVAHLESQGFATQVFETGNTAMRARLGIDARFGSCHTARVGGYAIEGHVPAREIHRLLREKPQAVGLAVPGMPVGSPGMDGPEYGGRRDPYDVLLLTGGKQAAVYQAYR